MNTILSIFTIILISLSSPGVGKIILEIYDADGNPMANSEVRISREQWAETQQDMDFCYDNIKHIETTSIIGRVQFLAIEPAYSIYVGRYNKFDIEIPDKYQDYLFTLRLSGPEPEPEPDPTPTNCFITSMQ